MPLLGKACFPTIRGPQPCSCLRTCSSFVPWESGRSSRPLSMWREAEAELHRCQGRPHPWPALPWLPQAFGSGEETGLGAPGGRRGRARWKADSVLDEQAQNKRKAEEDPHPRPEEAGAEGQRQGRPDRGRRSQRSSLMGCQHQGGQKGDKGAETGRWDVQGWQRRGTVWEADGCPEHKHGSGAGSQSPVVMAGLRATWPTLHFAREDRKRG